MPLFYLNHSNLTPSLTLLCWQEICSWALLGFPPYAALQKKPACPGGAQKTEAGLRLPIPVASLTSSWSSPQALAGTRLRWVVLFSKAGSSVPLTCPLQAVVSLKHPTPSLRTTRTGRVPSISEQGWTLPRSLSQTPMHACYGMWIEGICAFLENRKRDSFCFPL